MTFWTIDNLFVDNCKHVPLDPPVGRTVDELAGAWANMPGFNATAATDITVDGFIGKQVEFTVPDYPRTKIATDSGCGSGVSYRRRQLR